MKKKIVSFILVVAMAAASAITSKAAEPTPIYKKIEIAKELDLKVSSIKKVELVNLNNVKKSDIIRLAYDGKTLPEAVDNSNLVLQKVALYNSDSSIYILSASSDIKQSTGSKKASGIKMQGKIVWQDRKGIDNILEYVAGSRSGDYQGGDYVYGKVSGMNSQFSYKWDTSSFTDYRHSGMHGYCFILTLSMRDRNNTPVRMTINTSIFD
ncbi:MAG: hypothetical protein PUF90_00695 [Lachnospiraceae bacterium]|nr:hypothetical protein [Lachnospiraceae bacterium]